MSHPFRVFPLLLVSTLSCAASSALNALTLHLPDFVPAPSAEMKLGAKANPAGHTVSANSVSLLLDGKPWTPVMGEFHYARVPEAEWRESLLKAKAGGIDVIATYVFWIHHEEEQGVWNWSGERNLRRFVALAGELGLTLVVRSGPWCHGEVRNGGHPEWLVRSGVKLRSDDPEYLKSVRVLYSQISAQLKGLLWKEGGPVVAVQLENEYGGPGEHLLTLKKLALEAGLDVPLYTRTGWPELKKPLPPGEILPLYGAYAEGFWDRTLQAMPGKYWAGFHFSALRIDNNIANEALGRREAKDASDSLQYPFLTCELGGGMMSSYHRRIQVDPLDIESIALIKLGSGSNLLGYYMYKGGFNPEGKLSTLNEAQNTLRTNYNDLPLKNYDFQAPLGERGQVNEHYHRLRRLHLFLREFGSSLATMPLSLPDLRPSSKDDLDTLRWSVRSDGHAGYVFMSNHERGRLLAPKKAVQFSLHNQTNNLIFPADPVEIPTGFIGFWPFNFSLGHGRSLSWATAQPLCSLEQEGRKTFFFAAPPSGVVQFLVDGETTPRTVKANRSSAFSLDGTDGVKLRLVFLSQADSLALWKGNWKGHTQLALSTESLVFDGDRLRLSTEKDGEVSLLLFPALEAMASSSEIVWQAPLEGLLAPLDRPEAGPTVKDCTRILLRKAGPAPKTSLGATKVATPPSDEAFEASAAVWEITLPADASAATEWVLRLDYRGDYARLFVDGRLVADDFYNGKVWTLGLRAPLWKPGSKLQLKVLPIASETIRGEQALIGMPPGVLTTLDGQVAELRSARLIKPRTIELR